jgi:RNA polymerase sigma-70 factor, ECF subfamily
MHTTSVSLLQRLQQSTDEAAWARFVNLYAPLLYFWVQRTGFSKDEADDLVQDVFAALVRKLPQFAYDPQQTFRGWLRTLAVNKWREKKRRRTIPTSPLQDAEPATDDGAEYFWETEYQNYLVRRALDLMKTDFPERTWRSCWALIVEDKSPADVAAEFGMTVGAVHAAKFRVLSRLREELVGLID